MGLSFLASIALLSIGFVAPQKRPYFHMLLKTQCLFLAGDDIARDIEPFKIGPDMVSHVFSLARRVLPIAEMAGASPKERC